MELLERAALLAQLNAALEKSRGGSGHIALVSGEAGIGKTSLVEAFTRQNQNVRVLWGICDALYTPRPLGPLHDIALQTGGELRDRLEAEASRAAIFAAALSELQRRATVLVMEDVHWADDATLDWLRYISRRITHTPALIVLIYRDDELGAQHPLRSLLGELTPTSRIVRITVPPLSEQAVRTLVGEQNINAARLHRQTSGNPFFVTEVLANPDAEIPVTVRDAVLARAARLSLSGWAVLEAAAVIGQRIEPWLLAEVTGAEARAAEECIAAGLLLPADNLITFRHELARQTILETISPPRWHILSRLVLDSLKAAPATRNDLARLAHHAEATGDHEAVLSYAPAAAHQAANAGAHRAAATLYALALRFAEHLPPAEHAGLLDAYSRECNLTERQAEGIAARKQALAIWGELGNPLKQAEILASLPIMLRNNGDNAEAEQTSRAAIEMLEKLPPGRELAMAYRVQATLRISNRDTTEAIRMGEQAVALAEHFGDADVLGMAHIIVGSAHLFLDYPYGRAYLENRLALAREAGNERQIANLLAYIGMCSVELYQFEPALHYLDQGIEYTADRNLDIFRRLYRVWQSLAYFHLGRWREAAALTSQLMQGSTYPVISRIPALVAAGLLRVCRGEPGGEPLLDEALRLAEQTGTLQHLGLVHSARAEAAWLAGKPDQAGQEARAGYDLAASKTHAWFTGRLAYWRWRAGDRVELPEWAASPFALQIRGDWRAAAQAWVQLGCRHEQARALAEGDTPARLAALEIFVQVGAQPDAEILRSTLRESGVQDLPRRPHPSTRENPFKLTNRQLEILGLLVEGLSNPEIAARLHISPKTVDHHVSAVLGKLEVSSREAAAARALDLPHFQKK